MKVSFVQGFLSIVIVVVFVVTSAIIALTPVVGAYPPDEYMEHLKTFGSLYAGTVSLVLGYYFGKTHSERT